MLDLKKWLAVKDHRVEMVKSFVDGKTIAEISVEFNRPVTCVRYHMSEYMPSLDDIDAFKRKFAAKKLKTKRYER
tara:strand:- start:8968 stop:9192 length:225 start_codon:yes stop_codon:yes gene_type:complete